MFALLLVPAWALPAAAAGNADKVDLAVRDAKTYAGLSAAEQGDVRELEHAKKLLEDAKQRLEQAGSLPDKAAMLGKQIEDLDDVIRIGRWTQEGAFPLTGFLAASLFSESSPTAIYRLTDDPAIKATTTAAANLAALVSDLEKKEPPLPVVITSIAASDDASRSEARKLEQAARHVLGNAPQLEIQSHADVEGALAAPAGNDVRDFWAGNLTSSVRDKLMKTFGRRLLVVVIRRADQVADIYQYQTDGWLLGEVKTVRDSQSPSSGAEVSPGHSVAAPQQPPPTFSTTGFGRDRRDRMAWILWANAMLLVVAYAAYALIVYSHRAMAGATWSALVALPLVAFATGRILPYAVSYLMRSIQVPADTPALDCFWIACICGLGFLAAPMVAYWLASPWFAELWPGLSLRNRGGALFAAMGAGIAAYLAGPLLLYADTNSAIDVVLMSTIAIGLAYLLGRTLDYSDPLPLPFVMLPVILSMPAGAALLHGETTWLAIVAGLVVLSAAIIVAGTAVQRKRRLRTVQSEGSTSAAGQAEHDHGIPSDLQALIERAENPDYQPFSFFDEAWRRLSGILEGHCCHVGLYGPRGAGKTAAVEAMTARLMREKSNFHPAVLRGTCSQPIDEPISYAPFREALAQHFEVNLLAPPGPKVQQIGELLGGLFGSAIPFAKILFPSSKGNGDAAARPDEINASIAWMLRRLSRTRPILLILDDVQWIDEASAALVKHLLAAFPPGSSTPLAFILVANKKSSLGDVGCDVSQCGIKIAYPSEAEQAQILARGVGLQAAVADEVLARTGEPSESEGGLLWPLQVVAKLARSGALVRSDEGFTWAGGAWPTDFAIPAHMQAAIKEQWDRAAQYHAILGCAACGCDGLQFPVSVLAKALDRTRLDLLMDLDEIERAIGMVHDVRDRDDLYAFHSTFLLEVIRGKLGIGGHGAKQANVPQIVREYHARLAVALEEAQGTSQVNLYEVAKHYYAAGAAYAGEGVKYCLEAARSAAAVYDFRLAKNYLKMAAERAASSAAGPVVEIEEQIILCRKAQLAQGPKRAAAAEAAWAYLEKNSAAPPRLVLAVAQLCHDEGQRSRDSKWQEKATQLCRQIVADPPSPQEEAEARHIMAVSQNSDDRGARIAELRKAFQLLDRAPATDREASRSLAQIMNSLAKELRKGTAQEQAEAKLLFQSRLRMEKERNLGDLRGVATALGGLGRLDWFGAPRDLPAAERYFHESLDMAEAINDTIAQVKMHSLLGACAMERGDHQPALAHYLRSWELARDPIDRCFAAIGLLQYYRRQNCPEPFEATARSTLGRLAGRQHPSGLPEPLEGGARSLPPGSPWPGGGQAGPAYSGRIGRGRAGLRRGLANRLVANPV